MKLLKSLKRQFFIALNVITLCAVSHLSFAMGDKPAERNEQRQRAVEEFQENEKYQKQPICHEPLVVTISDVKLLLPRTPLVSYTTKENKIYKHMEHRCEIKQLNNISFVSWPNMTLYDASNIVETDFHKYIFAKIEASKKEVTPITLQNGIIQMNMPGSVIFSVPINLIPTYNKNNAFFNCGVDEHGEFAGSANCTTNYLVKNNLGLSYRYFGSNNKLEDMIIIDKQKRDLLEKYIVKK